MNKDLLPPALAERVEKQEKYSDRIRGCLFGGAVGDALGYPVEFHSIDSIHAKYGSSGITEYEIGCGRCTWREAVWKPGVGMCASKNSVC